jgi:hypothetical protein
VPRAHLNTGLRARTQFAAAPRAASRICARGPRARCYNRAVAARGALFRRWAGASVLGAAVLHLLTFAPAVAARLPGGVTWVLGLLVVVPFAAMIVSIHRRARLSGEPARWRIGRVGVTDWRPLLAPVPPGMRLVAAAAMAYCFLNFLLCAIALGQVRAVEEREGRAYRVDDGGVRHEVTREEHDELRALQIRLASGHLVLFALFPLIYFVCVEPLPPARRD